MSRLEGKHVKRKNSDILVTTTFTIDGFRIKKYKGVVHGLVVYLPTIGQDLAASVESIPGGKIKSLTEVCEQARQEAFDLMIQHAKEVGANAVIGMRYDISGAKVFCYGTAVVVEQITDTSREWVNARKLIRVVKNKNVTRLEVLLNYGADVNARNEDGETALVWAADRGCLNAVEALLARGANVDLKDKHGRTALMWATEKGHLDVVKTLLLHGADVNAKDENGETALMKATYMGSTEVVRVLISHGADIDAKDRHGRTAMSIAEDMGYSEIVQLLRQAGAKE